MGSFSIWHWLVVLVIVLLLFGTKKLGNIGSDLGKAIRGFKDGLKSEEEKKPSATPPDQVTDHSTVDVETKQRTDDR